MWRVKGRISLNGIIDGAEVTLETWANRRLLDVPSGRAKSVGSGQVGHGFLHTPFDLRVRLGIDLSLKKEASDSLFETKHQNHRLRVEFHPGGAQVPSKRGTHLFRARTDPQSLPRSAKKKKTERTRG